VPPESCSRLRRGGRRARRKLELASGRGPSSYGLPRARALGCEPVERERRGGPGSLPKRSSRHPRGSRRAARPWHRRVSAGLGPAPEARSGHEFSLVRAPRSERPERVGPLRTGVGLADPASLAGWLRRETVPRPPGLPEPGELARTGGLGTPQAVSSQQIAPISRSGRRTAPQLHGPARSSEREAQPTGPASSRGPFATPPAGVPDLLGGFRPTPARERRWRMQTSTQPSATNRLGTRHLSPPSRRNPAQAPQAHE